MDWMDEDVSGSGMEVEENKVCVVVLSFLDKKKDVSTFMNENHIY